MVENNEYRDAAVYVPGFIKVLKCYESTINAYVERCKKKRIEPNAHGDELFKKHMSACRNLHMNWTLVHRPATAFDIDVINALSMVLNRTVAEKLEAINPYKEVRVE